MFCPVAVGVAVLVLSAVNPAGLVVPAAIPWLPALVAEVGVGVESEDAGVKSGLAELVEPVELIPLVPTTVLVLLFLTVPPTAPPTTAPMTIRTMMTMAMTPLRLRQKDVRGFGAAEVCEPNFSPEPVSAMPDIKGMLTGAGWGVCEGGSGGGMRMEGVRRGGCSRRSTLYPSYMVVESCERQSESVSV